MGESGILIEPGNVIELRDSLMMLMSSPEARFNLGRNAQKRVKQCSWKTYGESVVSEIQKIR